MLSKIFCLTLLSASLNVTAALADGIRISIKNVYDETLDFGPLGKGTRNGTDTADGVLSRQGSEYVGTVDAKVDSTQTMSGMAGAAGRPPTGTIRS